MSSALTGPHGAGLANILWAANGTSVIEFALSPMCNRNIGMLAMMIDGDYWVVPQVCEE